MHPGIKFSVIVLILSCAAVTQSNGANILFLFTCCSYSHRIGHEPIIKKLAENGHQVTVISPFPPRTSNRTPHPNITEVVPGLHRKFMDKLLADNFDVNLRAYGLVPPLFMVIDYFCYSACEALYKSEEVKEWVETAKVDLVISDLMADCSYGLVKRMNAKSILYMTLPMLTKNFEDFGMNSEASSIPDYDVSRQIPLTFFNRVGSTLLPLWYRALEFIFYPKYKALFEAELNLTNFPNNYDMRDTTNLIITNGNYITDYPRSLPPFVVHVPGIHVKKPGSHNPIDKKLEAFINSEIKGIKSEGFIFMSFGTVAKAPSLPEPLRQIFFTVIKDFPQMRFIWRWEGDKPSKQDYPENLHLIDWVDQEDLLAHPRIKGFLTQAGRPSSQEALYNAVPTVVFPIMADQDFNGHRAVNLGVAILEDFVGLTEQRLKTAFDKLLTDHSYKSRVTQLSKLIKDVPMDSIDVAIWWIEFVLRHSQEELSLLKPLARHLSWYQKRELDVWIFLLLLSLTFIYATYSLGSRLLSKCLSKKKTAKPIMKVKKTQ